jgi:SAM-dependent methyltransferase
MGAIAKLRRSGLAKGMLRALGKVGLLRVAFSAYERVLAVAGSGDAQETARGDADALPVPPAHLRVLVGGSADVGSFLEVGRSMFGAIRTTLQDNGAPVEGLKTVLEFGCGCGRVLRHWQDVEGPRVYACDYNERLVDWCRANLPFAQVSINGSRPPLLYEDGFFDFVYAISVFTHLAEPLQRAWMTELRRVVRPGGHLLVTTHGASYRERLTPEEGRAFDAGRLVVRYQEASGMNLCTVYHPESSLRGELGTGFAVAEFVPVPRRAGVYQDLYLLRKQ